ncbi:MAG: carbohydrate-binding domain-containing protein, partial [Clostridiales bacterium]|nr:carbohydrate-binding domain-containing protein [Clostridiales bacterium]
MKKTNKITAVVIAVVMLAFSLTACTLKKTGSDSSDSTVSSSDVSEVSVTKDGSTAISLNGSSVSINGDGAVADGSVITVTSGGAYELSGTLSDGRIIVDADGEEVTLILSNANIACSYSSAIYVYDAKSTTIYVSEGTANTLSDGGSYTYNDKYSSEADEEPNACVYSKDDLVIAGSGTLTVNGNLNNGITGKDTLTIESINLTVNAKNTGIKGKDDLVIKSGTFTLDCEGDTIHGDNNTTIESGTFTLTSSDDGIHADNTVTINGGTYKISAHEGIEGTVVVINNGTIDISADDDGINAAQKIEGITPTVEINGGEITINMAQGDTDGIDSNGNIVINGGTVSVNGQSPFDCDGTATVNGGTVYSNGTQVTELQNQFADGMGGGPGG